MTEATLTSILPEGWQRARGFSHGMRSTGGTIIHVAGQVAQDKGAGMESNLDMGQQFEKALGNVVEVVRAAGGEAQHISLLRVFVTDIDAFNAAGPALGAAWGTHLGKHFPAMTLVEVTRLMNPDAVIEIEGEAVLP